MFENDSRMNLGVIIFDTEKPNWKGIISPSFFEIKKNMNVIDLLILRLLKSSINKIIILTQKPRDEKILENLNQIHDKYGAEVWYGSSLHDLLSSLLGKHNADKIAIFHPEEPLIDWENVDYGLGIVKKSEVARYDGFVLGSAPRLIISAIDMQILPDKITWKDINSLEFLIYKSSKNKRLIKNQKNEELNIMLQISDGHKLQLFSELVKAGMPLESHMAEIIRFLSKPEIKNRVLALFNDVRFEAQTKCPLCQGPIEKLKKPVSQPTVGFLLMDSSYYVICSDCKLVTMDPQIAESDLHKLYGQTYGLSQDKAYLDERIKFAINFAQGHGKILDIGGSTGKFCIEFKKQRPLFDVDLIDFSAEAIGTAKKLGINASAGNILDMDLPKNYYDIITLWEVIEHIPVQSCVKIFGKIHEILKPGGACIFSTPNYESFLSKVFDYYMTSIPFHLHVFSDYSLKKMINKTKFGSNFEVIGMNLSAPNWIFGWLLYYSRGASCQNLRNLAQINLEMLEENNEPALTYLKTALNRQAIHLLGVCRK